MAQETASVRVEADHSAPDQAAPATRCGSCGGPSTDGDLCRACLTAFGSVLGNMTSAGDSAPAVSEIAPREASASADSTSVSSSNSHAASYGVVAEMPPSDGESERAKAEAARAEAAKAQAAKAEADKAKAASNEKVQPAKTPKPTPVRVASVPPRRTGLKVLAGAAVVVLAAAAIVIVDAFGVPPEAAAWFGIEAAPQTARVEQPEQPARDVEEEAVAKGRAPAQAVEAPPRRESKPAPSRPASSRSKLETASQSGNQPGPSVRQVAAVVTPSPATDSPAPMVAKAPVAVAAEPRRPAREAPLGRLFEPTDVDESPKVASRVAPHLPRDLGVRPVNEVVVVRVLVSQSGHPFRVNLLRRSKQGRSLDDAVVAAVNQWTFSPAKKRGEAVSCWYNFGVPLGQAD